MLSTNVSELFTFIIKASVIVSSAMVVALLIALVIIRSNNAFFRQHQKVLTGRWRDIFKTAYTGDLPPVTLPGIGKKDWFTVLRLFLQFHEIREKDRPRAHEVFPKLDAIGRNVGVDEYALMLLGRGDDADKVLALNILGHMRDERAIDYALKLSADESPELSRAAAQCALRIHGSFLPGVLELIRTRDDWVRSRVEAMLREIGSDELGPAMRDAIATATDETKPRLLDYIRFCAPDDARNICHAVLIEVKDPEAIAAALRSLAPLSGERDRETALKFCSHESKIVALSALRVLRKCVHYDDRDLLVKLASDRDYWVRLRAAEAIVQLYGTTGLLDEFAAGIEDRYARDAIKQAINEQKMYARRKAKPDRRGSFASGQPA